MAEKVVIMDMRKVAFLTDFFIVASASSQRNIKAIADGIEETLEKRGEKIYHREGYPDSGWILLDAGLAICHIFSEDLRNFYGLERLWGDVPQITFDGRDSLLFNRRGS